MDLTGPVRAGWAHAMGVPSCYEPPTKLNVMVGGRDGGARPAPVTGGPPGRSMPAAAAGESRAQRDPYEAAWSRESAVPRSVEVCRE